MRSERYRGSRGGGSPSHRLATRRDSEAAIQSALSHLAARCTAEPQPANALKVAWISALVKFSKPEISALELSVGLIGFGRIKFESESECQELSLKTFYLHKEGLIL